MKPSAKQKIYLGAFTLAGIFVFVGLMFAIGSKKNIFTHNFFIYGTFRTVGGLQVGNIVRYSGIDVGTVSGIALINDSTVKVSMKLKESTHKFLKSDAVASIGSDGLMGDKLINISPGAGSGQVLPDGAQIICAGPVEFDKVMVRMARTVDNAEEITGAMADIAHQITSGKGSIGRLIYSDTLERGLEQTVGTVHATVKSIHATVQTAHETINTAHETINTAHEAINTAKKGAEGFQENMEALKHNVLLRGYYKNKSRKQAREERRRQNDSARNGDK